MQKQGSSILWAGFLYILFTDGKKAEKLKAIDLSLLKQLVTSVVSFWPVHLEMTL